MYELISICISTFDIFFQVCSRGSNFGLKRVHMKIMNSKFSIQYINMGDSVFFPDCYKFDNNIVDQIVEMNDKLTSLKL